MRLFFALWLPIDAAEQLAEVARTTAKQFGGKPTRSETIHLTLAFLGDVPETQLPLLQQTAQVVRAEPFVLDIDHLEFWKRNHLLWAGNASPNIALAELIEQLQGALTEAGFAVAGLNRIFTPHITLVRKLPESDAPLTLPAIDSIRWLCTSFALVCSQTPGAGATYRTLVDFPLNRR
jgi:2'-5' RNA ligase